MSGAGKSPEETSEKLNPDLSEGSRIPNCSGLRHAAPSPSLASGFPFPDARP
jgi:hypothetical protein